MTKELFIETTNWQSATFKQATALSKLAHLKEELQELKIDIENNNPAKRLEFADCFILLFGAAASAGMSYDDIQEAIKEKMTINYQRKWGKPNEEGYVKHE
jgi:NTP pyrophosphatase (non-canonical NTP hydrolase)